MITVQQKISGFFFPKAAWFGLVMMFGLPWSHAFFYIGLVGMLFCLAVSTANYTDFLVACQEKISLLALSLFLFIAIGALYTHAPSDYAIFDLKKYRKLLLVPVFILLYQDLKWAKKLLAAYSLGVFCLILPTLLDGTGLANMLSLNMTKYRDGTYSTNTLVYWRNHIVNGFHASILFAICVLTAIHGRRLMWVCIALAILCVLDIVFFIHGRMALIALLSVSLYVALSCISRPFFRLVPVGVLIFASVVAYQTSGKIQTRVNSVANEAGAFMADRNVETSGGSRLHYWGMSLALFAENPIFGAGPGSFRKSLDQPENPLKAQPHRHAHNEYLTQMSQHGLVGLILFLGLMLRVYQKAKSQSDIWLRSVVTAGLVVFAVNAVTDSSLHNESEGWTFVLLACLASIRRPATELITADA